MTCEFQKEEEPAPVSEDKSDDDVYKLKDDDEEKPESPKKMKKEIKRTPKVRFVFKDKKKVLRFCGTLNFVGTFFSFAFKIESRL